MIQTCEITELQAESAAKYIKDGQLVVFPTETVYGLGADACNSGAVRAIFHAKGRPQDNPLIVHVASIADIPLAARSMNEAAQVLFAAFSPGPITLILPRNPVLALEVSAGLDTVGVRIPSCPVAQKFLAACGTPVAAPSANRSGRPSPTDFAMAWDEMQGRVAAIVHGPRAEHGLESTIIFPENDKRIHILRPGSIDPSMIRQALDRAGMINTEIQYKSHDTGVTNSIPHDLPRAPGTRYRHYSPLATVRLFKTNAELEQLLAEAMQAGVATNSIYVLILGAVPLHLDGLNGCKVLYFETVQAYAHALYRSLVQADHLGCSLVFAALPEALDQGIALGDRLMRAAGKVD